VNKYANDAETTLKQFQTCFTVLFQFRFRCVSRL